MNAMKWTGRALLVTAILAVGVVGCKKDGDKVSTKTLEAAIGAVEIPENVLGFAGLRSLDDLSAAVGGIASTVHPQLGAVIGQQVPEMLRTQLLGLGSLAWMDARKPVRIVMLDHTRFAEPYIVMLPVVDEKGLQAALPAGHTQGEQGTTYKTAAGRDVYMNRLGDFAVFTMAPEAFAAARDFLRSDFAGYQFTELADIQVSSTNLQRVLAPQLDELQKAAVDQAVDPTGAEIENLRKLIDAQVDMLRDLLTQTEVVRAVPAWNGQDLTLRLEARVTGDQGLSKFVRSTSSRKVEAFRHLPEGGWLAVASNFDPTLFSGITRMGIDFYASFLQLDEAARTEFAALLDDAAAVQTGDTAFTILFDGEFPWRVASITGVTDGARARDATYAVYGTVLQKLGGLIDPLLGSEVRSMPKVDWTSFPAMIDSLRPTLNEAGIVPTLAQKKVGDVTVDSLELTVDYAKVPGGASDPTVQTFARVMGGKVSGAMGFDDRFFYGAFGKDAVGEIEAIAKGTTGAGQPLAAAIDAAGFQVAFAAHAAVAPLLKAVALVRPDFAEVAARVDPANQTEGLTVTLGAHGDRVIDAKLDVPVARLAKMLAPQPAEAPQPIAEPAPVAPAD